MQPFGEGGAQLQHRLAQVDAQWLGAVATIAQGGHHQDISKLGWLQVHVRQFRQQAMH